MHFKIKYLFVNIYIYKIRKKSPFGDFNPHKYNHQWLGG